MVILSKLSDEGLSKLSDEGGRTEERKAIIAKRVAGGKGEKILKKMKKVLDKRSEVWYSE